MRRALELASAGLGQVSPNPMVGCVIVHDGKVIGEGWHQQYGGPHAEVNAVESVKDKSLLWESTVYVNLEPCSHFGKTPPCADMLVQHHVKKVVVANLDSNPLVAGEGIRRLMDAGVEVVTGVMEKEGRELNRRFFISMEKRRPYVLLKWAQTSDGFMAREDMTSKWISNEQSRKLVHKWRAEESAVLVGTKTAINDNPQLNVREWSGQDPVRIIIDKQLKVPAAHHVHDRSQHTIIYNTVRSREEDNLVYVKLEEFNFLRDLLDDLHDKHLQSLMVEGGPTTLTQFLKARLWDEARVFTGQEAFGKGLSAPLFQANLVSKDDVLGDILSIYRPL